MGIFGSLNAFLSADNRAWNKGFKEARDEVDQTSAKTKSFFAQLKSDFGKSSMLSQSLKIAAGGGAIAAIGMAVRSVYELADAWMGTSKAEEAAKEAADNYAHRLQVIYQAEKEAKSWEVSMNEKLLKSYRDLDTARHPENKAKNELQDQLDAVQASLDKEKETLADIARQRQDHIKLRDIADQDLRPLQDEEKQRSQAIRDVDPSTAKDGGSYAELAAEELRMQMFRKINGDRMGELETTSRKETQAIADLNAREAYLRGQARKDEITGNQIKLNIIAKANADAANERAAEAKKANEETLRAAKELAEKQAREQQRIMKEAAESQLRDKKYKLQDQIKALDETIHKGRTEGDYRIAQTSSVRGAITVQTPKVNDALVKAAQKAEVQRNVMVQQLQALVKQGGASSGYSDPTGDDDSLYR